MHKKLETAVDVLRRNHVRVQGEGPRTIVFAHGFGCDQRAWRHVTPDFERDSRVVLFDYVGCGQSDIGAYDPARYQSLDGYAQDLLDVVGMVADDRPVSLVAHSVSGMVGVRAAQSEPGRFDRMVMIGPSPHYLNDPPDYFGGFEPADVAALLDLMERNLAGWAGSLAPQVMLNDDRPELTQELADSFCAGDPAVIRNFADTVFYSDSRTILAAHAVPTLLMECVGDIIAPPFVLAYLHRHLHGSLLVKVAATGHFPHLSHPGETTAVIRGYLDARA
ncbi:alpha/beta fold hydrolase [Derxia lacustris]|uniref:alpha/beta fold hydrolase n=1 Tax=Derxia lacustris TaxID=764842 RepID=UPI000A16E0DC|nr:alpha/beta hydrolase [Derxia lacustris]